MPISKISDLTSGEWRITEASDVRIILEDVSAGYPSQGPIVVIEAVATGDPNFPLLQVSRLDRVGLI